MSKNKYQNRKHIAVDDPAHELLGKVKQIAKDGIVLKTFVSNAVREKVERDYPQLLKTA